MISTRTLLYGVIALISLDILTTLLTVGCLGATELNALASIFGFSGFMVIKVLASIVAVYIVYKYCIPSAPTTARCGMAMLGIMYGAACASNTYQLIGAVA